jgi:hypothetical protein
MRFFVSRIASRYAMTYIELECSSFFVDELRTLPSESTTSLHHRVADGQLVLVAKLIPLLTEEVTKGKKYSSPNIAVRSHKFEE